MSMTKQQQIDTTLYTGGTKYDLSPADLYGQAVISEYLKQQRRRTIMKTEQEQIEQIEKVLKDSVADYKHLKKKGVCYCYAETLIDSGYGDVSEYKAEIERLKSNNGFLQCVISHSKDMMDEAVKQAQINVLNKVKERAVVLAAIETYHICNLIDEIIKEVQNAEDKG